MSHSKYCEQCGKPLNHQSKFCVFCGAEIRTDSYANQENNLETIYSKNYFCNKCNLSSSDSDRCIACGNYLHGSVTTKIVPKKIKRNPFWEIHSIFRFFVGGVLVYVGNRIADNAGDVVTQAFGSIMSMVGSIIIFYTIYLLFFKFVKNPPEEGQGTSCL